MVTLSAEAPAPGQAHVSLLPFFLREANEGWDGLSRAPEGSAAARWCSEVGGTGARQR